MSDTLSPEAQLLEAINALTEAVRELTLRFDVKPPSRRASQLASARAVDETVELVNTHATRWLTAEEIIAMDPDFTYGPVTVRRALTQAIAAGQIRHGHAYVPGVAGGRRRVYASATAPMPELTAPSIPGSTVVLS